MTLYAIAIDVGFGWTKYCHTREMRGDLITVSTGKFPTAFAHVNDAVCVEEMVPYHVLNGLKYVCGEHAVHSTSGFSIRDLDSMVRYAPIAVAEVLRQTAWDGKSEVELALGLPPADYRAYRDQLKAAVREIPVVGRGVAVPKRVEVYPQAVVAKIEVDMQCPAQRALLLDVGHNTADAVAIVNGRVAPNDVMTISMGGVARAVKDFADLARFRYNLTFATTQEAFAVMQQGYCHSLGRRISFNGEVDAIIRGYVDWLLAKVRERWDERLRLAEALIVLGGGAAVLRDHFPPDVQEMVRILPDPEYANTRAYMLLLCKAYGARVLFT